MPNLPTVVEPIAEVGSWVKFLRHNGNPDLIAKTHVAKAQTIRGGELTLVLYNKTGGLLANHYWVPNDGTYVQAIDEPEFETLLSHLPNTPELQAAKDAVWRLFTKYGRTHGYDRMVSQALTELGINKPNAGKIEATISFTVNVDTDKLNPDTDITNFKEWFDNLTTAERLLALAKQAKSTNVSIKYELVPSTPTIGKPSAKAEA